MTRNQGLTLELDDLAAGLLLTSKLEVLASLDGQLNSVLAVDAFHTEHNLLGGLGLLTEDRLGLTSEARLLSVVTATTLGKTRLLALLVLRDLVVGVLATLAWAESTAGLGNVDHLAIQAKRVD
jgi:hypothetical protein